MAETIGSLVDKITIVELKIYHMAEQIQRPNISGAFAAQCTAKLVDLNLQSEALADELDALVLAPPKPFPQFKMYNDPQYRSPTT